MASQAEHLQNAIAFFNTDGTGKKAIEEVEQIPGMVRTKPRATVVHIKHHEDVEMEKENGNGKPTGYGIDLDQNRQAEDDLDDEFERY